MRTNRMEAFSDGVIAIIITIMVLELAAPREATPAALLRLAPVFLSYLLSFIFLAIFWNNHHHLIQAAEHVNGGVLWANMHLLFWLSLFPFVTAWVGAHPLEPWPVALYGFVFFFASIAYYLLSRTLIALHGRDSVLGSAVGSDLKGISSTLMYLSAIPLSFVSIWISYALYLLVALIWFIPDRRIEKNLEP